MSVLGLTVVGALIPSVVSITVGLTFTMGDVTLNFQEGILDMIMLGIMPVLATWIVHVLIKRRVNLIAIIMAIIVISMVCSAFGILVLIRSRLGAFAEGWPLRPSARTLWVPSSGGLR